MQSLAAAAANDMSGFAGGSSGDLPPPSPPAEKTTTRQDQARESGSCVGTGNARPTRLRCLKQKRADRGQASTLNVLPNRRKIAVGFSVKFGLRS
jgi:hypothetical protein